MLLQPTFSPNLVVMPFRCCHCCCILLNYLPSEEPPRGGRRLLHPSSLALLTGATPACIGIRAEINPLCLSFLHQTADAPQCIRTSIVVGGRFTIASGEHLTEPSSAMFYFLSHYRKDFEELFDIIITNALKPGFFSLVPQQRPFRTLGESF